MTGRACSSTARPGPIGTAAVQLAKHFGAHVTAVCNTKNVELVRSLGADEVVDYLQEDFTKNGKTYDVIVDAVGKHSFRRCRGSLKPGGVYVATDPGFMWHVPLLALLTQLDRKAEGGDRESPVHEGGRPLPQEAHRGGEVPGRSSTGSYPLEHVVEAAKYVETGQKTGNVVLTLNGGSPPERK